MPGTRKRFARSKYRHILAVVLDPCVYHADVAEVHIASIAYLPIFIFSLEQETTLVGIWRCQKIIIVIACARFHPKKVAWCRTES